MLLKLLLAGCLAVPLAALPSAVRAQPASQQRPGRSAAIANALETAERFLANGMSLAAEGEFQRARREARAQQNRDGERRALVGLARVKYVKGQYSQALPLLQQAERLAAAPVERGPILSVRGLVWLEQGDYRRAHQALRLGASFLQQGDFEQRAALQQTRIGLGRALGFLGWYDRALQTLEIARRTTTDNQQRQVALQAIADVQFDLGQYTEARDTYQRALTAPGTGRDRLRRAQILARLGQTEQVLGNLTAAEALYQEALGQIRGLGAWSQQVFALNFLGQLAAERGDAARALAFFQQAQGTFSSSGGVGRVETLLNLGRYYLQQGQSARALEFFNEALLWAEKNGDRIGIVRSRSGIGEAHLERGDNRRAVTALEASLSEFEALRPGLRDSQKVSLFETQRQTYRLLQKVYIRQNKPAEALVAAERGRARAFVELLASRLSEKPLAATGVAPPNLVEILSVARQQKTTLVSYSILYDGTGQETDLLIWVVDPGGTLTFRQQAISDIAEGALARGGVAIGDNRRLEGLVAQMRRDIRRGGASGQVALPARQAHRLAIEPIADLLPGDPSATVTFVPDGPLFLLPLPALQDAEGRFLIERHAIAVAPSIQAIALTESLPELSLQRAAIVGNPAPMPQDLAPLPGAETEAQTIAELLQVQPTLGSQATEANVRALLPQASHIHLATHGFFDARQGLQSSIALVPTGDDDGFLTAAEILDLELKAGLAVLSACDTGRGQITGDGVIGLSRSLMSAGVPTTLVTLWAIPDLATAELMAEFYRQLQQNPAKPQALRQAMLATKEKYPSPRDWASFALIGRPN